MSLKCIGNDLNEKVQCFILTAIYSFGRHFVSTDIG